MSKLIYGILDHLNEGIIILDNNLKIVYLNDYIKHTMHMKQEETVGNTITSIYPELDKKCYTDAFWDVKDNGVVRFFSGAIHKELIKAANHFNLKITRIESENQCFLLLEFINVSSQMNQISQLKAYVSNLWEANKELKEKEKIIKNLAYYDKLTGVANRTLFYEISNRLLNHAKENQTLLGLMFIDVNKFKAINDTYGHEIGDKILARVAEMLVEATRDNDVVARYGGDEFLILLPNMKHTDNYNIVASRIIQLKNKTFVIDKKSITVSLSMGVSFYPDDGDTVDKLVVKADMAMYQAKRKAGEDNCCCVCNR